MLALKKTCCVWRFWERTGYQTPCLKKVVGRAQGSMNLHVIQCAREHPMSVLYCFQQARLAADLVLFVLETRETVSHGHWMCMGCVGAAWWCLCTWWPCICLWCGPLRLVKCPSAATNFDCHSLEPTLCALSKPRIRIMANSHALGWSSQVRHVNVSSKHGEVIAWVFRLQLARSRYTYVISMHVEILQFWIVKLGSLTYCRNRWDVYRMTLPSESATRLLRVPVHNPLVAILELKCHQQMYAHSYCPIFSARWVCQRVTMRKTTLSQVCIYI